MPVVKILFTATTSYVVLFLSAKLIGHKQIAQLDSFDYITGITIGSIAAEMATDLENPWQSFTAMVVYMLLTWLMTMIGMHSLRSRKFLNGSPSIIMQNGRLCAEKRIDEKDGKSLEELFFEITESREIK